MTREAQVLLVPLARPVQAGHQGTSVPRAAQVILERQGRRERLERLERAERLVSSVLKDARARQARQGPPVPAVEPAPAVPQDRRVSFLTTCACKLQLERNFMFKSIRKLIMYIDCGKCL